MTGEESRSPVLPPIEAPESEPQLGSLDGRTDVAGNGAVDSGGSAAHMDDAGPHSVPGPVVVRYIAERRHRRVVAAPPRRSRRPRWRDTSTPSLHPSRSVLRGR